MLIKTKEDAFVFLFPFFSRLVRFVRFDEKGLKSSAVFFIMLLNREEDTLSETHRDYFAR